MPGQVHSPVEIGAGDVLDLLFRDAASARGGEWTAGEYRSGTAELRHC